MTNASTPPSPAPMEGRGAYNRSSRVQAAGLSPAVPLLERAASVVSLSNAPEAIVIADYGSSEGRNSLSPMTVAIGALRERVGPNRAISPVVTPTCPATTLTRTVRGLWTMIRIAIFATIRPYFQLRRLGVRIINRFCHQTASH